ncbi:MAG TPA: EutN/CcmL family microcompartment protein [Tepidisphaeraceae bacterium]|jgi:ethanolamine utilization protein EutN
MQLATVIGHATSTIKHSSMVGLRLIIAQPLGVARKPEADPVLAVDKLGSHVGQNVLLDSDGRGARELVGDEKSPVRWCVVGIVDE